MSSRRELANAIRALSMDAVQKAKSGHPGAPMGMADIAEVLWNDHFGNSQTNITPSELNDIGVEKSEAVDLKIGDSSIVANWFNTYQELEENTPGIVTDSWGMISIVINNKSALDNLNTTEGTKIEIKLSNSTKNQ